MKYNIVIGGITLCLVRNGIWLLGPRSNVELHMSRTQCKLGKSFFKFICIEFGSCEVQRLARA